MKKTYLKTILIILLSVSFLVACGQIPASKNNGKSEQYTIVTSFYPIYLATLNVAKNIPNVQVINMTEPQTGCLHDYQLAPKDLKTLENADVFVINGAGMEAFMDKVISQMPELKIIEASQGIKLIKNTTDGTDNVHVWVSITDAILQVKTIGAQLAVADPPHAEEYTKNVAVYVEKLESLKAKMHKELDKLAKRDIVTMHEAFPYFAKEFNLNIVAIVEREPGSAPSAGELAATIEKIKKSGVRAIFAEPQYADKAARAIAAQTGTKVYNLDPVVTGENTPNLDGYLLAMDANLKSLLEALKNE